MFTVWSTAGFEFGWIVALVATAGFVAWATCLFAVAGDVGAGYCCGKDADGLGEADEG